MRMLIYLHGFRSSPRSEKARLLAARMAERGLGDRLWCRQLPPEPRAALALVEDLLATDPAAALVGSSLGGYYAAHLAAKHRRRAVLINPAARAPSLLAGEVGIQTNLYTGETFEFKPEYVEQLEDLQDPGPFGPEDCWLLVETGDEILDYRDALATYAGARQTVVEGGDHNFRSFPKYVDGIIDFALEAHFLIP
jgi:predicted esterase YcpF (UPF0227 family)